mmetsp:Transcript_85490/g.228610  ORF Transcript_85490/g.228610 Transcript_85490/m.228610 type:complete len:373 (-) Transcript_85490:375-1493(-)
MVVRGHRPQYIEPRVVNLLHKFSWVIFHEGLSFSSHRPFALSLLVSSQSAHRVHQAHIPLAVERPLVLSKDIHESSAKGVGTVVVHSGCGKDDIRLPSQLRLFAENELKRSLSSPLEQRLMQLEIWVCCLVEDRTAGILFDFPVVSTFKPDCLLCLLHQELADCSIESASSNKQLLIARDQRDKIALPVGLIRSGEAAHRCRRKAHVEIHLEITEEVIHLAVTRKIHRHWCLLVLLVSNLKGLAGHELDCWSILICRVLQRLVDTPKQSQRHLRRVDLGMNEGAPRYHRHAYHFDFWQIAFRLVSIVRDYTSNHVSSSTINLVHKLPWVGLHQSFALNTDLTLALRLLVSSQCADGVQQSHISFREGPELLR